MSFILNAFSNLLGWAQRSTKTVQEAATDPNTDSFQRTPAPTHSEIWTAKTANQRKHRIDEVLHSFTFFFGSMLDDLKVQKMVLVEKGDCLLITAPRSRLEKSTTHRKWFLLYLTADDEYSSIVEICYHSQKFVLAGDNKTKRLEQFMRENKLKPVERPVTIKPDQICDRVLTSPSKTEDQKSNRSIVDKNVLLLGRLNPVYIQLDSKRRIPCLAIRVNETEMSEQKCKRLANEARKMLNFGSIYTWRIWAICHEPPTKLTILMENIAHGSLSDYVRQYRPPEQLARFALQMVEALRYLEKFEFVHGRLTLDTFLVTYDENVKLMIFGLCDWTLLPECDDHDEIVRCRWFPPECQPCQSEGMGRVPYTLTSMVYTFGLILWSMHHAAVLPFEDERARNIQSGEFRVKNEPVCDGEMMSKEMIEVARSCWSFPPECRPKFKELKHTLRDLVRHD